MSASTRAFLSLGLSLDGCCAVAKAVHDYIIAVAGVHQGIGNQRHQVTLPVDNRQEQALHRRRDELL
jgi:hypothetical protein